MIKVHKNKTLIYYKYVYIYIYYTYEFISTHYTFSIFANGLRLLTNKLLDTENIDLE